MLARNRRICKLLYPSWSRLGQRVFPLPWSFQFKEHDGILISMVAIMFAISARHKQIKHKKGNRLFPLSGFVVSLLLLLVLYELICA